MGLELFKAVFGHWIGSDIQMVASKAEIEKEMTRTLDFLIEAKSSPEAFAIARKYEGLETHSSEGIGELMYIIPIDAEEAKGLTPITIYDEYLVALRERKSKD